MHDEALLARTTRINSPAISISAIDFRGLSRDGSTRLEKCAVIMPERISGCITRSESEGSRVARMDAALVNNR